MEVSFQFSGLLGLSKTLGQTNEFNELSPTQKAPFWHLNFPKSRRAGQQTLSRGLYTNVTVFRVRRSSAYPYWQVCSECRSSRLLFIHSQAVPLSLPNTLPNNKSGRMRPHFHQIFTHTRKTACREPAWPSVISFFSFLFTPTLCLYLYLHLRIVLFSIFAVSVSAERGGERDKKERRTRQEEGGMKGTGPEAPAVWRLML